MVCLFVLLQLVGQEERTNPAIDESKTLESNSHVTPEVSAIVTRSCNDCHSNKTVWPWYSNVAPVSWTVISHVTNGRRFLNFSEWAKYDERERDHLLAEMCKMSKSGFMPLQSYTRMHRNAKLSEGDVKALCDWTAAERSRRDTAAR